MFKNKVIRWTTLVLFLTIVAYFIWEIQQPNTAGLPKDPTPEEYTAQLLQERADKDIFFGTSSDSPIEDKGTFESLEYFEPDLRYRVKAKLTPYDGGEKEMTVTFTDGTTETYERYKYATFSLDGNEYRLLLVRSEGTVSLLFKDATSGTETYGGGRYLDFPVADTRSDLLVIDFNEAYNPYCVYNPSYACPLPPQENTLSVAIRAGEKYIAEKP
jgi:uncharacterized protein (DUF1684 family)